MPTLGTARAHFDSDIARAEALRAHALTLPAGTLRDDVLRSSWMFGVGASDAYFSDAYADLIARALRAKDLQPAIALPDRLGNLRVPVVAVIRSNNSWRWRMAARELIEDENVLSIEKIKQLFNHFFDNNTKIISKPTIESWLRHTRAKKRIFGRSRAEYDALTAQQKDGAKKDAVDAFIARMTTIFQRRHDCIHNCDRPKVAPQRITPSETQKALYDIKFLVERSHDALVAEFPQYLSRAGFSAVVRNQVTQ